MAQSQYDAPIAEFFKWSDELHKEINDSSRLLNAFLLIKPDLLKDFSYYADAWLDIAGAKRAGFDVVFNLGQYILQSIVTGEYGGGNFQPKISGNHHGPVYVGSYEPDRE